MLSNKLLSVITTLFLITAICACSTQPSPEEIPTHIAISLVCTQNFGQELIFDKTIEIPEGTSALDALKQVVEVETAYGGAFVTTINGVHSQYTGTNKNKKDWFLYINGVLANVGAEDYILCSGDVEHWDLRDWSFRKFVTAIVGDFPQPFLHGYRGKARPTIIVYTNDFAELAEHLINKLVQLGVNNVSIQNISELSEDDRRHSHLILLGSKDCDLTSELNAIYDKLGLYTFFKDDKMIVFHSNGEVEAEYRAETGLIQAVQNPWNPKGIGACENVVWIVSGTDEIGVVKATLTLINHYDEFRYACAVVVVKGEIIKVPR